MRKKVDNRVRILVENSVKCQHRCFFLIVGDRGKDQVVNLHYMLTKIQTQKPSVLWCYKKDLGFSSHRKKRIKELKRKMKKGLFDPNIDDPFELFVSSTQIRYCYYKETESILGQTFGMCVLQDFEALTPNILCRTIETVQGGGIICILLQTMTSLRQLYTMTMDVHRHLMSSSFKEEHNHDTIEYRFNERFLLSLSDCSNTIIVDDEFNILPLSHHVANIIPTSSTGTTFQAPDVVGSTYTARGTPPHDQKDELDALKSSLKTTLPCGPLVSLTATLDQAKALMSVMDTIIQKSLSTTICVTAGRGRGKSAMLGLSICSAIAAGYSNIFVTSPSPENVKTLFEFIHKGLTALQYQEHSDFELIEGEVVDTSSSSTPSTSHQETSTHIVRVNVFREHRQTIQYILPTDVSYARQSEILVIDEAAAIPLPIVKNLLGPYMLIFSSTVNGYEGTGRALSLKLIQDLKRESQMALSSRIVKELDLTTPIRYALNDPIEKWLNTLLCLDATKVNPLALKKNLPLPAYCQLYEVNRRALFSYHNASEVFLQKLMSLFISSHYKNSPNDLLLLSDAPSHYIFVLLGPLTDDMDVVPDIFVAIHVSIEGAISKDTVKRALSSGTRPSGDLIPWTLSQNFIDEDFGSLNCVRIVRIATHPAIQRLGYGSEAIRQLCEYFEKKNVPYGDITQVNETIRDSILSNKQDLNSKEMTQPENHYDITDNGVCKEDRVGSAPDNIGTQEDNQLSNTAMVTSGETTSTLRTEVLHVSEAPPLLHSCKNACTPLEVHYIGVAFGVTLDLFKFYNRLHFEPVYLRQTVNDTTGDHSAIMLRCSYPWLSKFTQDFKRRLATTLGSTFSHLPINLALCLVAPRHLVKASSLNSDTDLSPITHETIHHFFSSHDLFRLQRFSQLLSDRSLITDLLPMLTFLIFTNRLPNVELSYAQSAILVALGLQHKPISAVVKECNVSSTQVAALFNKAISKIYTSIHALLQQEVENAMIKDHQQVTEKLVLPNDLPSKSLEEELNEESLNAQQEIDRKRNALLQSLKQNTHLQKYNLDHIGEETLTQALDKAPLTGSLSVRLKKRKPSAPENPGFSLKTKQ